MEKTTLPQLGLDRPSIVAVALIGGIGIVALMAWLAYGTAFYMTLFDTILSWCM